VALAVVSRERRLVLGAALLGFSPGSGRALLGLLRLGLAEGERRGE
jgi:hypothetical protein